MTWRQLITKLPAVQLSPNELDSEVAAYAADGQTMYRFMFGASVARGPYFGLGPPLDPATGLPPREHLERELECPNDECSHQTVLDEADLPDYTELVECEGCGASIPFAFESSADAGQALRPARAIPAAPTAAAKALQADLQTAVPPLVRPGGPEAAAVAGAARTPAPGVDQDFPLPPDMQGQGPGAAS